MSEKVKVDSLKKHLKWKLTTSQANSQCWKMQAPNRSLSRNTFLVLGFATKKNRDWFNENNEGIQELLVKKRSAHQAHLAQPSYPVKKVAFCLICSNHQHKVRVIQNKPWNNFPERTHLPGPESLVQCRWPVLFTDKASNLSHWSEHFLALFIANLSNTQQFSATPNNQQ